MGSSIYFWKERSDKLLDILERAVVAYEKDIELKTKNLRIGGWEGVNKSPTPEELVEKAKGDTFGS